MNMGVASLLCQATFICTSQSCKNVCHFGENSKKFQFRKSALPQKMRSKVDGTEQLTHALSDGIRSHNLHLRPLHLNTTGTRGIRTRKSQISSHRFARLVLRQQSLQPRLIQLVHLRSMTFRTRDNARVRARSQREAEQKSKNDASRRAFESRTHRLPI